MRKKTSKIFCIAMFLVLLISFTACSSSREKITNISQLDGKEFAIPTGTAADQLVLSKFPNAKFKYFNSVLDACLAVKAGKADAVAYDEPLLRNIAAKNPGLTVLPDMVTVNPYGYAVQLDNQELKNTIDEVIKELKANRTYDDMIERWMPKSGAPAPMPNIELTGNKGVLRFGTSTITEPFSFIDGSKKPVGFDIELATYVAKKLDMQLEIVNMDFGGMIPALMAGKVDMIGACITITDERKKSVLFSEPYYIGGIAALVKE